MTTPKKVHLAKQPGSAVLVSWCGVSERRRRKADGAGTFCNDENPIVRAGDWTCDACAFRMRAESSRIQQLLGTRSAEVEALRDAALATSCGNHGCVCAPVRGVGTNGACHCQEMPGLVVVALRAWRRYATALEAQSRRCARDEQDLRLSAVFDRETWPKTREAMRHALGLDNSTGSKRAYRNHFSVARGGDGLLQWQALADAGLAEHVGSDPNHHTFRLTQRGIELVTDYSEREKESGT